MRTVSYEEFLGLRPCWMYTKEGRKKLKRLSKQKERWTALDVLDLPGIEVSAKDKLWAVLREEFIEAEILHEFACQCAEHALELVRNHDPGSRAAIEAKRRWLRGEIGDDELREARGVARATARGGACEAAQAAARSAACEAAQAAARAAAWEAAWAVVLATAWEDAQVAVRIFQAAMLRELLAYGTGKKEVSQ